MGINLRVVETTQSSKIKVLYSDKNIPTLAEMEGGAYLTPLTYMQSLPADVRVQPNPSGMSLSLSISPSIPVIALFALCIANLTYCAM